MLEGDRQANRSGRVKSDGFATIKRSLLEAVVLRGSICLKLFIHGQQNNVKSKAYQ